MLIMRIMIDAIGPSATESEIKIRLSEFKTMLFFLFKLSLESGSEVMLDYPLDTLAKETATACFEHEGIEDLDHGEIHLN